MNTFVGCESIPILEIDEYGWENYSWGFLVDKEYFLELINFYIDFINKEINENI